MENIGWWLCSREQGMWKDQLQQAKEIALGLLLILGQQIQQRSAQAPNIGDNWSQHCPEILGSR